MLREVYRKWGYEATNDDMGDAYSLARLLQMKTYCATDKMTALSYEQECIEAVRIRNDLSISKTKKNRTRKK